MRKELTTKGIPDRCPGQAASTKGKEPERAEEPGKGCYVGVPAIFSLNHVCAFVAQSFGEWCCYLVGSATRTRDFRDVDVRLILGDKKWHTLFGEGDNGEILQFWSLLNVAIAEYMRARTGLPIDFQIQSKTQANGKLHGKKSRVALGIHLESNKPEWAKLGFLDK